ncbi:MAG: AAA family ATPase [Kiritimatiellae bacterium]|nr:AAA family ATPase [Kiritimatiellia bacterium]
MKIESLKIENFKALKEVSLEVVPEYAVFVGANGTGKSTLFDVFGFLRDCLIGNVRQALQARGSFKEVVSRGCLDEDILIELKFRMPIANVERLVTYKLCIGLLKGQPMVKREVLSYKRGRYGSPFHFLDFAHGKGYAISNEEDFNKPDEDLTREDQKLDAGDILAIKGLGQFERFKAANAFRQLIENWHVSDFHIHAARGDKSAGYAEHLSVTGDNLPLVAHFLFEQHREVFDRILETMKRRVPGISDIQAKSTEDGRLVLRYQDGAFKDPFIDRYVSDGTIKMFAYLVLLYDPQPHPLLCVEEPENQLYPQLMLELAEEFGNYTDHGGQVFVSTHSPDFLNGVKLGKIFWLRKEDGFTTIHRAQDKELLCDLVKEGDLPGALLNQEFFEAVTL